MGLEFLEGNEAIARAAVKANCGFFAGYPITPSSSILHRLLNKLPKAGGVAIQAEDEIASIGMCIGAAMAGAKVLTATSGPGISLYSENIGLAIMGEVPMVIVNVQRQGPATGAATKGAEGDILFTRWCTSAGLPTIVLSPADVAEAYELTYRAFNLAERYRVPVFVLTNKEVATTRESVDLEQITLPPMVERARPAADQPYLPYHFNAMHEVPEFADMGGDRITRFTTSSHDEAGQLTTSPEVIQRMIDHCAAKVDCAADDIALVKRDMQAGAEVLLLGYGIVSRSMAVAAKELREQGHKVSLLTLQSLYPVPKTAIAEALTGIRRVVVPEMNLGQYIQEIRAVAHTNVEVVGVNKMDTTLLSPAEIISGVTSS